MFIDISIYMYWLYVFLKLKFYCVERKASMESEQVCSDPFSFARRYFLFTEKIGNCLFSIGKIWCFQKTMWAIKCEEVLWNYQISLRKYQFPNHNVTMNSINLFLYLFIFLIFIFGFWQLSAGSTRESHKSEHNCVLGNRIREDIDCHYASAELCLPSAKANSLYSYFLGPHCGFGHSSMWSIPFF